MRKWLGLLTIIAIGWEVVKDPAITNTIVYGRPSTSSVFQILTTVHRQNKVNVNVDGRRNWYFSIKSLAGTLESPMSPEVYLPRGY